MRNSTIKKALLLAALSAGIGAGVAKADTLQGYPCDVSLSSGDQLSVTLYSQTYCNGSYVGLVQVSSVDSSSQRGPGTYFRDSVMRLFEQLIANPWKFISASRDGSNRVFSIGFRNL